MPHNGIQSGRFVRYHGVLVAALAARDGHDLIRNRQAVAGHRGVAAQAQRALELAHVRADELPARRQLHVEPLELCGRVVRPAPVGGESGSTDVGVLYWS